MPLIDTPFVKVTVDMVAVMSAASEEGNPHTMTDLGMWCPGAMVLSSTKSKIVAERLAQTFSRVNHPQKIVYDRRTNFASTQSVVCNV